MKKGLIIVFGKDDIEFENKFIFKVLNTHKITICLVNNGNYEAVCDVLKRIKEKSAANVFILNLKKEKALLSAVKAGVRSLINSDDFETIIYTKPREIKSKNNGTIFLNAFEQHFTKKENKRVLLRSLYAIDEVK